MVSAVSMSVVQGALVVGGAILAGVAALRPSDVRVAEHSHVIFAEDFEQATVDDVFAHWGDVRNSSAMSRLSQPASCRGGTMTPALTESPV